VERVYFTQSHPRRPRLNLLIFTENFSYVLTVCFSYSRYALCEIFTAIKIHVVAWAVTPCGALVG
jgi:hypothetical protein